MRCSNYLKITRSNNYDPYQGTFNFSLTKEKTLRFFSFLSFLTFVLPFPAFSQKPGDFDNLFTPSALITLAIVIGMITFCSYIKKNRQNLINQSLANMPSYGGLKIIGLKPFEHVSEHSGVSGYYFTVSGRDVTEIKERKSVSYTTSQGWEIKLKYQGTESWSSIWLHYGEYDKLGRIREGEFKKQAIGYNDIRPGETVSAIITGEKRYDIVLEEMLFCRRGADPGDYLEEKVAINLKMPKDKILSFPVWIIAFCIAFSFCYAASNVMLIIFSIIAVIVALSSLILRTLASVAIPILLYGALTTGLTLTAILCGLYLGLDFFTKKSWKDYFGGSH